MAPTIRKRAAKATARLSSNPTSSILKPRRTTSTATPSTLASSHYRQLPSAFSDSAFTTTKRDKRQIKHSRLLSRISKTAPGTKSGSSRRSRKRKEVAKNQQLSTSLTALLDALPSSSAALISDKRDGAESDTIAESTTGRLLRTTQASASANASAVRAVLQTGRSLKSRPGLQKRRAGVAGAERERFAKNLAVMAVGSDNASSISAAHESSGVEGMDKTTPVAASGKTNTGDDSHRSERWAALRRHIEASLSGAA